jgi:hypothetical protein
VFLLWLLKELWTYWIYVDFSWMPARASTGVALGVASWNVCCGVGEGLVFAGALLGPEAICLWVWCLRTVEWMRASLWSSY